MVYATPVAREMVTGDFYDSRSASYYLSPAKLESDYAPVRFERERRLFRRYCTRGAVLDVGCSTGAFLFHLKALGGYQVTGLDVAGATLDYAESRGLEVVRTPFLEWTGGGRSFDAVTFWAVLEHVLAPKGFLEQAARLLRPGGWCFALVPNFTSLSVRLLGPKYRYVTPEHLNYFTAATLKALVAAVPGFELVRLRSSHFNPVVMWHDLRHGGPERVPDQERARLLQQTTALKQEPALKPLKAFYVLTEKLLGSCRLADDLVLVLRKR